MQLSVEPIQIQPLELDELLELEEVVVQMRLWKLVPVPPLL